MEDTTKESNNQALTLDAYNNLTKVINDIFQKVFMKFGDLKDLSELSQKSWPSNARGGEEGISD